MFFDFPGNYKVLKRFAVLKSVKTWKVGQNFPRFAFSWNSLLNLMCNSNLQILLPGPMLLYITKYLTKSNVLDDTMTFERTLQMMLNRLLRKEPTDFGEGEIVHKI